MCLTGGPTVRGWGVSLRDIHTTRVPAPRSRYTERESSPPACFARYAVCCMFFRTLPRPKRYVLGWAFFGVGLLVTVRCGQVPPLLERGANSVPLEHLGQSASGRWMASLMCLSRGLTGRPIPIPLAHCASRGSGDSRITGRGHRPWDILTTPARYHTGTEREPREPPCRTRVPYGGSASGAPPSRLALPRLPAGYRSGH
jgi:hypothetical protein